VLSVALLSSTKNPVGQSSLGLECRGSQGWRSQGINAGYTAGKMRLCMHGVNSILLFYQAISGLESYCTGFGLSMRNLKRKPFRQPFMLAPRFARGVHLPKAGLNKVNGEAALRISAGGR